MFKSPISFMFDSSLNDILKDVVTNSEDLILEAVHNVGIHVDKEKLIQVLEDSKHYYDEGFKDGKEEGIKEAYKNVAADNDHYYSLGRASGLTTAKDLIEEALEDEYTK